MANVYDEVTQNGFELQSIIVDKYMGEIIMFDDLANEIKELNKTVFVPHFLLEQMAVTPRIVNDVLKSKQMIFAQLSGTNKNNERALLGVVIGSNQTDVQQVITLYNTVYQEAAGQTRH